MDARSGDETSTWAVLEPGMSRQSRRRYGYVDSIVGTLSGQARDLTVLEDTPMTAGAIHLENYGKQSLKWIKTRR